MEIPGIKVLLQSMAERDRGRSGGAHPETERLVAYHFGKLSGKEEARIQDHMTLCHDCARRLLELAEFCLPSEADSIRPSRAQIEKLWARIQEIDHDATDAVLARNAPASSFFQRFEGLFAALRPAYVLTALLLAVSLLIGFWIYSLNREKEGLVARLKQGEEKQAQLEKDARAALEEAKKKIEGAGRLREEDARRIEALSVESNKTRDELKAAMQPQLNAPIAEPTAENTRGEDKGNEEREPLETVTLNSRKPWFGLIISAPSVEYSYSDYEIRVVREPSGRPIWLKKGLRADDESAFTLILPSRLFPAGEYRFLVFGIDKGRRTQLKETSLHIRWE